MAAPLTDRREGHHHRRPDRRHGGRTSGDSHNHASASANASTVPRGASWNPAQFEVSTSRSSADIKLVDGGSGSGKKRKLQNVGPLVKKLRDIRNQDSNNHTRLRAAGATVSRDDPRAQALIYFTVTVVRIDSSPNHGTCVWVRAFVRRPRTPRACGGHVGCVCGRSGTDQPTITHKSHELKNRAYSRS